MMIFPYAILQYGDDDRVFGEREPAGNIAPRSRRDRKSLFEIILSN